MTKEQLKNVKIFAINLAFAIFVSIFVKNIALIMEKNTTSFPLLLQLDFQQILQIVLQLPEPYKKVLANALNHANPEIEMSYIDKNRGTLEVELYQKNENKSKNWSVIKGKWPGDESDEQIIEALDKLS